MDPDLVRAALKDAVSHVEDVGYRTRAQDITDEAPALCPSWRSPFPSWQG
jgi:hypothetical protein